MATLLMASRYRECQDIRIKGVSPYVVFGGGRQSRCGLSYSTVSYIQNINHSNMEEERLPSLLRELLSTPASTLAAHATLKQRIQGDSGLLPTLLEELSVGEQVSLARQQEHFRMLVVLHPVLIDLFPDLPPELQDEVRSALLSVVVAQQGNLRAVAELGLLVREVLEIDGVEPWVEPLGELMKWAASDELSPMRAGIEFFLYLLKETAHTRSNCEGGLYRLAPVLLERLFGVFASQELGEGERTKLLCLVLQIVKTFSPLDGVQDGSVRVCFDGTFELWMSLFVSALQGSLPVNLSIKKYILKIFVVIFRDMHRYLAVRKSSQPGHLLAIWEFTYRLIPLYLWGHVWRQDLGRYPPQPRPDWVGRKDEDYLAYDDEADALCSTVEALALVSLEFLSVLTSVSQLQGAIRVSVHHLTNALFHYMLVSGQELAGWKGNAQHFSGMVGNLEYESGVRGRCLGILNELIEKFGDMAIQAILVASEKFLLNLPQTSTLVTFQAILNAVIDSESLPSVSGGLFESEDKLLGLAKLSGVDVRAQLEVSGESWHKVETALLVLGRFSEDVIVFQSKQAGSFDIEAFVQGIVRQVKDEQYYSLLKGQSLYCLTRFIEIISIKYRSLFSQLVGAALSCNLPGAPLALRTIACKAASAFLKKVEKHKLELSNETVALLEEIQPLERVCEISLLPETISTIIEILVELCRSHQLKKMRRPPADYTLALFTQCLSQQSMISPFLGLLEGTIQDYPTFSALANVFIAFSAECLKAYAAAVKSDQKRFLKPADSELVLTALQVAGVFVGKSTIFAESGPEKEKLIELFSCGVEIMEINEDVPLHVSLSLFLKSVIRAAESIFAVRKELIEMVIGVVRLLLRIPKDKSFESGSIYAGNLVILLFDRLLGRNHNEILQEIVLKVFRSRTPSVVQSLVLVYARLINTGINSGNKFVLAGEGETKAREVVDFLSSFSIENRMGLKILIDKWLLQQSLFRGKHTKTATFMALSRLFLLNDKRVDNLLVIGFNPSHTNVNNDVNAPLKILATLIRCLDNEMSGSRGSQEDDNDDFMREQPKEEGLAVELQKFKEEEQEGQRVGGSLADRENQQGSTCYMSAMLQFYDDGEECDDKTEEDLIFLGDSSINFNLAEYLNEFLHYLAENRSEYFKECVKGLLRQDVRTLQKYVKF